MQVLKYEYLKKDKYNVYLSTGEVLELSSNVITRHELLLKKEITTEEYNNIIKEEEIENVKEVAIKYISIRLRSIKEIEDYLKKKGYETSIIQAVKETLLQEGYLDDNRFAKAYIKDKFNLTSMGDYKIKINLIALGLSPSIIDNAMIEVIDTQQVEDKIKKQIEKDLKSNKKYQHQELKNKIYNHLVSAGFSKEKVISVINKYNF